MVITFFSSNHQNWVIEFDLCSNNSQLVDGFRSKKEARGSKQTLRATLSMAHISSDTLRHQGGNEPATKNRSSWRKLTKPVIERRQKQVFLLLANYSVWPISFNPESMVTLSTTNIQNAFYSVAVPVSQPQRDGRRARLRWLFWVFTGFLCFPEHCSCSSQSCDFPFKLLRKQQSKVQLTVESLALWKKKTALVTSNRQIHLMQHGEC